MIPLLQARVPPGAAERVAAVLASGYINHGANVKAFEAALAKRLAAPEVLVVNSCTSALVLALMASDLQDGLVLTTPMTFVATTTAICQAGARPLWADVEACSCQMSVPPGRPGFLNGVTAIMAVAWAGWLPDLRALRALADELSVPLILDAAQAFGARFDGRELHEWADFVCYSFQATKHIACGDGGAIICRDPADRDLVRRLSWFGMSRNVTGVPSDQAIALWGLKANMNEIAAALGLAGLETVDPVLERGREIAVRYAAIGAGRAEERRETLPAPWLYTIFVDDPKAFIAHAAEKGVEVKQPHHRNDRYPFTRDERRQLPNTNFAQECYVSLPIGWWLSDADVDRVIAMARSYPGKIL